jgi:DNA-binding NarL/FixJ family response regulator
MTTAIDKPTDRQLELLAHLCAGLNIAEAAGKIFVTERTAYNMMGETRRKVGAGSTEQLVVIAFQEGWLIIGDEGKVIVDTDFSL